MVVSESTLRSPLEIPALAKIVPPKGNSPSSLPYNVKCFVILIVASVTVPSASAISLKGMNAIPIENGESSTCASAKNCTKGALSSPDFAVSVDPSVIVPLESALP